MNRRDLEFEGLEEIKRNLEALGKKVEAKTTRIALGRAAVPIRDAARENAQRQAVSGLLAKAIGTKVNRNRRTKVLEVAIGVRTGFGKEVTVKDPETGRKVKRYEDPANIAHLIEFGTAPHSLGKDSKTSTAGKHKSDKHEDKGGGQHPGSKPMPYLRPAFDANVGKAESILISELRKGIETNG